MKELMNETKKSQDMSKPVQTTRYEPKDQPVQEKMTVYSNTKNPKQNSVY